MVLEFSTVQCSLLNTNFICREKKEVVMSEIISTKRIKCPQCLNYMIAKRCKDGIYKGCCPVCKATITTKQTSSKEITIKILNV